MTVPGDVASASVFVAVAPADAFAVFTEELDLWWRQGPRFRIAGRRRGQLHLEPGPDGRVFETFEHPKGDVTIEIGKVLTWEPPARLVFRWRNVNFKPDESTTVEITFVAERDGTMVTVRHAGWSAIREGHPARHGLVGRPFTRMIGMWWAAVLTGLREHVRDRP